MHGKVEEERLQAAQHSGLRRHTGSHPCVTPLPPLYHARATLVSAAPH